MEAIFREDIFNIYLEKRYDVIICELEQYFKNKDFLKTDREEFLNKLFQLCNTYVYCFRLPDLYKRLEVMKDLENKDPEMTPHLEFLQNYFTLTIHYTTQCHRLSFPYLDQCIRYTIYHRNHALTSQLLNKLGNYYSALQQTDLCILAYQYSLQYTYQHLSFFKKSGYFLINFPLSNLLRYIPDSETRKKIMLLFFDLPEYKVDMSMRIFLGDRLESDYTFIDHNPEASKEMKEKVNCIRKRLYGELDPYSTRDHLIQYYLDTDLTGLKLYNEQVESQMNKSDHFTYAILCYLMEEENDFSALQAKLDIDTFYDWSDYFNELITRIENEEFKEILTEQFVNAIRQTDCQLDYERFSNFIKDLCGDNTLYNKERTVGELLYRKAGNNGIYERSVILFTMIHNVCEDQPDFQMENVADLYDLTWETKQLLTKELNRLCDHEQNQKQMYGRMITNLHQLLPGLANKKKLTLYGILIQRTQIDNGRIEYAREIERLLNALLENNEELPKPDIRPLAGYEKQSENAPYNIQSIFGSHVAQLTPASMKSILLVNYILKRVLFDYPAKEHDLRNWLTFWSTQEDKQEDMDQESDEKPFTFDDDEKDWYSFWESDEVKSQVADEKSNNEKLKDNKDEQQELITDNSDYQKLAKLFEEKGWKLDTKDLNVNFLRISKGKQNYLLYLFNGRNKTDAWLADEERFNDGDPLWFSESSHLVSPIFKLKKHRDIYLVNELGIQPVLVMLPPTYIINADDEEKNWEDIKVISYRRLTRLLNERNELDFKTQLSDINTVPKELPKSTPASLPAAVTTHEKNKKQLPYEKERVKENKDKILGVDPWDFHGIMKKYHSKKFYFDPEGQDPNKKLDELNIYDTGLALILKKLVRDKIWDNKEFTEPFTFEFFMTKFRYKFCLTCSISTTMSMQIDMFTVKEFDANELDFFYVNRGNNFLKERDKILYIDNLEQKEYKILLRMDSVGLIPDQVSTCFKNAMAKYQDQIETGLKDTRIHFLNDENRRLAISAAKAAIMSRNMSHNLGSHVMAYLKQHLNSVDDIVRNQSLSNLVSAFNPNTEITFETLLEAIEANKEKEEVELPFLVGLGRFINYLQERQDFIATVATSYVPYTSPVNFKDAIYDELNPDLRHLRHSDRAGIKPNNILLSYIAKSEGLERPVFDSKSAFFNKEINKNNILLKYNGFVGIIPRENRKEDGSKGNLITAFEAHEDIVNKMEAALERMKHIDFALPGGSIGRQAIFSIFENIIRNTAKHGHRDKKANQNLEFDINIIDPNDFKTKKKELSGDKGKAVRYNTENEKAEIAQDIEALNLNLAKYIETRYLTKKDTKNLYLVTITDNLEIAPEVLVKLIKKLHRSYIDEESIKMDNTCKGIKEMRISAAWLRDLDDSEKELCEQYAPVLSVRASNGKHLQYIFCVQKPHNVAVITDGTYYIKKVSSANAFEKHGWQFYTIDQWNEHSKGKEVNKNFEIILVENTCDNQKIDKLKLISPDRVLLYSLKQINEIIKTAQNENQYNDVYAYLWNDLLLSGNKKISNRYIDIKDNKVIRKQANINNQQDKIHIEDGRTYSLFKNHYRNMHVKGNETEKGLVIHGTLGNVVLHSDVSNGVEGIRYLFRTHYGTGEPISGYTENELYVNSIFVESITGNNATNRLIRNTSIDEIWYFKQLNAVNTHIMVIDERIFAKTSEISEEEITSRFDRLIVNDEIVYAGKKGTICALKNTPVFNLIEYKKKFYLIGLKAPLNVFKYKELPDEYDSEKSILHVFAEISTDIQNKRIIFNYLNDGQSYFNKTHKNNYITIHQGLLDKIYNHFPNCDRETKHTITETLKAYLLIDGKSNMESNGFIIHSGRSRPSKYDMPQEVPFVQFAAIDTSITDSKSTFVELLNFSRYEDGDDN